MPMVRTKRPIGPFWRAKTCSTRRGPWTWRCSRERRLPASACPSASCGGCADEPASTRCFSLAFDGRRYRRRPRCRCSSLRSGSAVAPRRGARVGRDPGPISPCRRSMLMWFLSRRPGSPDRCAANRRRQASLSTASLQRASRSFYVDLRACPTTLWDMRRTLTSPGALGTSRGFGRRVHQAVRLEAACARRTIPEHLRRDPPREAAEALEQGVEGGPHRGAEPELGRPLPDADLTLVALGVSSRSETVTTLVLGIISLTPSRRIAI